MEKEYAIGIDLGGTSVKYALIDNEGVFYFQGKLPSKADVSAEAVIGQLVTAINEVKAFAQEKGYKIDGIGMLQYGGYCLVSESAGIGAVTIGLQFHYGIDKAINRSLSQWESHGDIDILHFLRNGMKYGKQQSFITKHYSIFFFLFYGNL